MAPDPSRPADDGAGPDPAEEPAFDATGLISPDPVLDTEDLAAIAALPELPELPGERRAANPLASLDHPARQLLADRRSYRKWLAGARPLAAAGIIPGPSHYRYRDRLYPIWGEGFWASDHLQDRLAATGATHTGDPLVLFGYRLPDTLRDLAALREFPGGYPWTAVTHQSAGVGCSHPRFIGIPLTLTAAAVGTAYRLGGFADHVPSPDHGPGHVCVGIGPLALFELGAYYQLVTELGLSADGPWAHLQEGVSPLDLHWASELSLTPVPANEELWPPPPEDASFFELLGAYNAEDRAHWGVYVLGPNCD